MTESVRLACLAVGIAPDLAQAAALAHARMSTPKETERVQEMLRAIRATFDFSHPPGARMTASEVCAAIGIATPTRTQQADAGRALIIATQRRPMKTNGRQVYVLPKAT